MSTKESVIFSWSGGKDSAFTMFELRKDPSYRIAALLTTVTRDYGRISMHGVREELLNRQAEVLGVPLEKVYISKTSSNEEYENQMRILLEKYSRTGVNSVVFGDIFLEDLRKYREDNLAKVQMKAIFPIWKRDTARLAKEFIQNGFKAVITCVDSQVLDPKFAGREIDEGLLADLPAGVDPCGENGEFHSFVYAGPIFSKPIPVRKGEVVCRENRFYFCDLVSA